MPSIARSHHGSFSRPFLALLIAVSAFLFCCPRTFAQNSPDPNAPAVRKVEPPNWWVGLTQDVVVLLSGKTLEATHAQCNLPDVSVSRTTSSANGVYLFIWL